MAKKRSNGEGSIRKNVERKRWEARATITASDGRTTRKMVTGRTRDEVIAKLREAQSANEQGQERASTALTVGKFLDEWAEKVLPGSVAASTEQQYRDVIKLYIKPHIGRKKLVTLNAREVAGMVRAVEASGKSPNTQRLARSILRRALRWAEHEGLVARNAAAVSYGVKVPAPEGRTMTVAEAKAFLATIEQHRLRATWATMLTTGVRRGELLGLAWSDLKLDAQRPTLVVRRTLQRLPIREAEQVKNGPKSRLVIADTKTKTSRRTVQLPDAAVSALRAHRALQNAERLHAGPEWVTKPLGLDLVFRTEFGTPLDPDGFRQATYVVTEAAGLGRWSPHELRHCAASMLIALGVPLKTISEMLGHSSIRVTADVYGHLLDDARAEAANAINEAFA